MQNKEPSPRAKPQIDIEESYDFLAGFYSSEISDLKELTGGKHSKAFSYKNLGKDFVIRFSTEDRGFLKDKRAYELFGNTIPIPKIIEINTYKDLHYCISQKISGETVRDQYNRNDFDSIPLLLDTTHKISSIEIDGSGYGYLDPDGNAPYESSSEYIQSVYNSKDLFDWEKIFEIEFVDKNFTDYVAEMMIHFAQFGTEKRELLHGDFGADNVFVKDDKVSGIIDWEKTRSGDHFLDIGRVLLFCPNRKITTSSAIKFYENKDIKNWKERALMGVYHVVLTNYAYAAMAGNKESCDSSKMRLKEIEQGLGVV